MLRKIRIALAVIFFLFVTSLFLDFSGTMQQWFAWTAKIQFLPAVLALNVGVVVALIVVTLLFGRLYCSVICPLGVMQDGFSHLGGKLKRNRFRPSKNLRWIRVAFLVLFVALMVLGLNAVAVLIAPYSAFGRIAANLFAPLYDAANNLLAWAAEKNGSFAFRHVDIFVRSGSAVLVAAVTFLIIALLSLRWGRLWCNTVCPVGTVLGFFARFSLFRPIIDTTKCNGCAKCARNCKSQCIDPQKHEVDMSRCVACMDCLDNCPQHAIAYKMRFAKSKSAVADESRRKFVIGAAAVTAAGVLKAQQQKVDGGLAVIMDRQMPSRKLPVKPFGSISQKHFASHCTSCQLCVSACPNQILTPSKDIATFLQPELSFDKGYCRPECTRCSEVCPSGAIRPITSAQKSTTHVGVAVWLPDNCLPNVEGIHCGNCAEHCPAGAIYMVPKNPGENPDLPITVKIPAIDTTRCIGCGACEYLCPARPVGAIYVEGRETTLTSE